MITLSFINAILVKFKHEVINCLNNYVRAVNTITYCRFPFMRGFSYELNGCFIGTNVRLAFYNLLKISSVYTRLKDALKKEERSGEYIRLHVSVTVDI